ncbi:MAG: multicopper oxidase domain-containing protein [Chloroflexi bacterium]|nr:multicopper oxidase domain-containing protein [Chloroflexota bacterium]
MATTSKTASFVNVKTIDRRQFLKYGFGGLAVIVVGSKLSWLAKDQPAFAATQTLSFRITDAVKGMVTDNAVNSAKCYFWVYKAQTPNLPADCPGPIIVAAKGDTVNITVFNALDEPHAFFIPGTPGVNGGAPMVDSGPIAPNTTWSGSFTANVSGAHLYFDNLNAPVNRMMGLHGALIVMPTAAAAGHKFTPYDSPTTGVQKLYDDFGSSAHFPGLAWEQGDPLTNTPPFRQYVWLDHQASPVLFAEVGNWPANLDYPAQQFLDRFLRDPFNPDPNRTRLPQYFTINGQSGFFSHFNPHITPMVRAGEPMCVHILNAGLWYHSMHLHANHMYITCVNGVVQENPLWVDVWNVEPMERVDYTIPAMRIPDVGTARGIGLPDAPLIGVNGRPCYPPVEEMDLHFPPLGTKAKDAAGNDVELGQRMSPLCYPMHDHAEPTQTAQGGNYNLGLISGIYFTGDRNANGTLPGGVIDFPVDADFRIALIDEATGKPIYGISATSPPAPPMRP